MFQVIVIVRKSFYRDIILSSYVIKFYNFFKIIVSDDISDIIGIKNSVLKQEFVFFLVYFVEKKRFYRFEIIDDYVKKVYKVGIIENIQDNFIFIKEVVVDMMVRFYEIYIGNEILVDDVIWIKFFVDSKYILLLKKVYKMGWFFDYVMFNLKEIVIREYVLVFFYYVVLSM